MAARHTKEHHAGRAARSARDRMIATMLRQASKPLSAYDLINLLRDQDAIAPTTVYRSLSRLIAAGMVHRIESLNAFVSCTQGCKHRTAMFAICDTCGAVTEFEDTVIADRLAAWARSAEFSVSRTAIELRGRCKGCGPEGIAGAP
jgi:Fur family transcriptional regulator, zinc uptake regulator